MTDLKNISKGDAIDDLFIVASVEEKVGRNGAPYLTGKLQNKSGLIPFKMWGTGIDGQPQKGDVVQACGDGDAHEGQPQIILRFWETVEPNTPGLAGMMMDLIPHSPIASDELWSNLLGHIENIGHVGLRDFMSWFCAEREKELRAAPAAITMHHAYAGGLLEHINGLADAGRALSMVYDVDPDIMIAAAILHDIGKIRELISFPTLDYTTAGNLIGHICIGVAEVSAAFLKWNRDKRDASIEANVMPMQEKVPLHLRQAIMHLIASHHGTAEHGAARPPATLEAMIFHHLDMIDSRAWMFAQHVAADQSDGEFTNFHRGLEARLWKRAGGPEEINDANQ